MIVGVKQKRIQTYLLIFFSFVKCNFKTKRILEEFADNSDFLGVHMD